LKTCILFGTNSSAMFDTPVIFALAGCGKTRQNRWRMAG
jgi:hypothetical protein